MARDIVLLDRLGDNPLRVTIGIDVGGIPLCDLKLASDHMLVRVRIRTALTPRSQAAFSSGSALSGPSTQGAHSGFPMLMHPTIGTDTRSPLFPTRR